MSRRFICSLAAVLATGCLIAATSMPRASARPAPYIASIDSYAEQEMRQVHIPGLAGSIDTPDWYASQSQHRTIGERKEL